MDSNSEYDYEYVQFKNNILQLIYGNLPSYAYFTESNLEADLNDGYWHDFSDDECKDIVKYFMSEYYDTKIDNDHFDKEDLDPLDLLINLLLDHF